MFMGLITLKVCLHVQYVTINILRNSENNACLCVCVRMRTHTRADTNVQQFQFHLMHLVKQIVIWWGLHSRSKMEF